MLIEFRPVPRIEMERTVERESRAASFSRPARRAKALFKGHDIHFANGDHHVLQQQIALSTRVVGHTVEVQASFLLRDGSGNTDDPYDGGVDAVVIAETA